jgi:polyhydroxyalkanoate synthesis regulator phasin
MKSDIKDMKSDINVRFDNLESKVDNLENEVRKTNITIENVIKPKIEALFDGYKQNTEAIYELTDKVDYLQSDINNLTIRTLKNENNIIHLSKH